MFGEGASVHDFFYKEEFKSKKKIGGGEVGGGG